jgi:hypothetical protein
VLGSPTVPQAVLNAVRIEPMGHGIETAETASPAPAVTHESAAHAQQLRWSLGKLWAVLNQQIGSGCVAIIGITGADDHWCVVYRVTLKTLRLLDSSGRRCIRRSRCTARTARTRYCLEIGEILLIER